MHIGSVVTILGVRGLDSTSPVDCQNIQKDLDTLTKWEKDWQMSFNDDKCLTICFSTKKSNLDTTYVLNNHVLTQVHHHSYLGVILCEDLKWSEHIVHNYNIKCQTNSQVSFGGTLEMSL